MAKLQASAGDQVTVLSPAQSNVSTLRDGVDYQFVRLVTQRPFRDLEFLIKARARLCRLRRSGTRFDVLHAHGAPYAAVFLRKCAKRSVHSVDFFRYGPTRRRLGYFLCRAFLARFDANLPVSDFCASAFQQFYPSLKTPVMRLYNGVDLGHFADGHSDAVRARMALSLPEGRIVLYLGRVCEQKGSDLLAPLARGLRETHPDAVVVAAGPPQQFGLEGETELVRQLRNAGVICPGAVDEEHLPGLLGAAEVFVLPTRQDEMFGMAAVEAAAAGAPVVAANLGGIPEAVGPAGQFFDVGDTEALLSRVRRLLDDDQERSKCSAEVGAYVRRFEWSKIVDSARRIYDQVLAS